MDESVSKSSTIFGLVMMLNIIVRSKRDADAVKAMIARHYSDWDINVYTLHGSRSVDEVSDQLNEIVSDNGFYIIMFGREDEETYREIVDELPPNAVAHLVPRSRVRNARLEQLAHEFDTARSLFRLTLTWDGVGKTYLLNNRKGQWLEEYEINPAYDIFMGFGGETRSVVEEIAGGEICDNPLLVRKFNGEHDIYCGSVRKGFLKIPDEGIELSGETYDVEGVDIDLNKLLDANRSVLDLFEKISIKYLEKHRDWADTVIIPWSGGKDSTAALIMALKTYPKDIVKPIYVDTGVDFPCNRSYVMEVSEKLGVEPYIAYAGVDKALLNDSKPLPTHENRWCTGLKIDAIRNMVREIGVGNILVVTGDRDAESLRRSERPQKRFEEEGLVITPLKLWSTLHVQLYLLLNNIPLNPLYLHGFYRIGCYICPSLRSWELYIMLKNPLIKEMLSDNPLYKLFLKQRLHIES